MAEKAKQATEARPGMSNGYDPNLVKEFIDRRERIQDDQDALASDVKELFKEAKDKGLPVKALRKLLAERRAKEKQGSAYNDLMDQVDGLKAALGDFGNTDLGKAALAAAGDVGDLPPELDRRKKAGATA